jgi:2-dehydropantoate 2-reductase
MKVCIFGAGAIGTHIAARMAGRDAAEVSVVARGAQLDALRRNGAVLKFGGEEFRAKAHAVTDDASALPPQDLVLVTLKAHALPPLARTFERLLAPQGSIVFMLNGIPWWWPYRLAGASGPLPLLDPGGELWNRLRERTLGCVIYSPNELEAPGIVAHHGPERWVIGEPSNEATSRLGTIVDLFNDSKLPAERVADLRDEIWRKLVNNASGNTIAALTRLDLYGIGSDPELRRISIALMRETLDVAAALGWDLRAQIDCEKVAGRAAKGRGTRPSMLQDVLLGRPIETEALLGQTQAFAREREVAVPTMDVILPLLRGLDRSLRETRAG